MLYQGKHLCYCTNIHPSQSWTETFESLQTYLPQVRAHLGHSGQMAIGLRLSAQAAVEIQKADTLSVFKHWLEANEYYVPCINGFPYGNFHRTSVKTQVHEPDWNQYDRLDYTISLANILAELLPSFCDFGAVSTNPIGYAPKYQDEFNSLWMTQITAAKNLARVAAHCYELKKSTGKTIFIDIEPEPDGIIESPFQAALFRNEFLVNYGKEAILNLGEYTEPEALEMLTEHLRILWDVCHFAVLSIPAQQAYDTITKAGWKISRMQVSAALKADLTVNKEDALKALTPFAEPVYLHQAAVKHANGRQTRFPDLIAAINFAAQADDVVEIRTHYHVPLHTTQYEVLEGTHDECREALAIAAQQPDLQILEAETYTFHVLPTHLRSEITTSLAKEIEWIRSTIVSL